MSITIQCSYVELFPRSHLYNTPSQLRKLLKDYCLRPEKIRNRDIQGERQHYQMYLWEHQKTKWNDILLFLVCYCEITVSTQCPLLLIVIGSKTLFPNDSFRFVIPEE